MFTRVTKFCEASKCSEAEAWVKWGCVKTHGEFNGRESWEKLLFKHDYSVGLEDLTEDELQADSFRIDSG